MNDFLRQEIKLVDMTSSRMFFFGPAGGQTVSKTARGFYNFSKFYCYDSSELVLLSHNLGTVFFPERKF